jgi:hypothetical protein
MSPEWPQSVPDATIPFPAGACSLIAKLKDLGRIGVPTTELSELRTESDVEQKLVYPFLVHPAFAGIPAEWVRTKEYMEPTDIDKSAGKRYGYIPDYSVWRNGFPLLIVEAKAPDEVIVKALREAQMYASRINNRYPPGVNPISYVLACNGEQFALAAWDSEVEVLYANAEDLRPGTDILGAYRNILDKAEFEKRAAAMTVAFQTRRFHRASNILSGAQINEVIGVNSFAHDLFPIITEYFGQEVDDEPDEIMDRGYVTSEEQTEYGAVLESYLKDRARVMAGGEFHPLNTGSKPTSSRLTAQLRSYRQSKRISGRVQLIVGGVGAGKSLFMKRFYHRILPSIPDLVNKTLWAVINFNTEYRSAEEVRGAVLSGFIQSFREMNNLSFETYEELKALFHHELVQWERGPIKMQKNNMDRYNHERYLYLTSLSNDKEKVVAAISRSYTSEKEIGLVVIFDNVDKRSRDVQLSIFEAAQWFKDLTRALVIVNLRDTTYIAHRDEKPLDAFKNAVNFYIRAPRFSLMIRKRLELVLEKMQTDEKLGKRQRFTLESGAQVSYASDRLSEFLLSIYTSMFDRRVAHIGGVIESLVAKDARSALAMFADIIASPHIPTSHIGSTAAGGNVGQMQEDRIIRALMRGRFRMFNNKGRYVRNILSSVPRAVRPSNFLYADILEFLIRRRKEKIDFSVEGYASARTIVNRMGQLGYDEQDAFAALSQLAEWEFVQPESLITEKITMDDPIQVHASGYIHLRWFLQKPEYVMAVSADMNYSSYEIAQEAARVWGNQAEPGFRARQRMVSRVADYLKSEYERRVRRHAFYGDVGYGGKQVVALTRMAADAIGGRATGVPGRPAGVTGTV